MRFIVLIIELSVAAELVCTRCPCPKISGHGIADRGNACFTRFPCPNILGHGFAYLSPELRVVCIP